MKIQSITIEGLHNIAGRKTYQFSDLTYFCGRNGVGKSTILQSIQLALLGYIPGTNKTKSEIFKHRNGRVMAVTLNLSDNGQIVQIRRVWSGSPTNVTSSVEISPATFDISSLVKDIELPIFNFSEFTNMTANKLKDWFIEFLPSADVKTDWTAELTMSAVAAGVDDLTDLISSSVDDIKALNASGSEEVRRANEYFKSALSFKKKELERAQATIQSLIFYDDVCDEISIDEINNELLRYTSLQRSRESAMTVRAQNDRIELMLQDYEDIANYENLTEDPTYARLSEELSECRLRHDELVRTRNDLVNSKTELTAHVAGIRSEISIKRRLVSSDGICPFTSTRCESVQSFIETARSTINTLESDVETAQAAIKEIDDKLDTSDKEAHDLRKKIADIEYAINQLSDRYARRKYLKDQLRPEPAGIDYTADYTGAINKLKDTQIKYAANQRYNQLIDKLTADRFRIEREILAYKEWITLTGVNGLQSDDSATLPFIAFSSEMNKYIQSVFGTTVTTKFNLESKANSFSFGLVREGTYVPFNMLSSGEKCLYTLALMICLVNVSKSSLKLVMIDDLFDHLDDDNILKLFESLSAVSDVQLIFAGVKPTQGCTYIN